MTGEVQLVCACAVTLPILNDGVGGSSSQISCRRLLHTLKDVVGGRPFKSLAEGCIPWWMVPGGRQFKSLA